MKRFPPLSIAEIQARIGFNKKLRCLGVYSTPEEAHAVYLTHRQQLFGEFA
jgi:hypothetical protein